MDAHAKYWDEALSLALDAEGLNHVYEQIPTAKRESIAMALAISAENQGIAFGHDAIPNPMHAEMREKSQAHATEIKRLEGLLDVYRKALSRSTRIEEHRLYVNNSQVMVSPT